MHEPRLEPARLAGTDGVIVGAVGSQLQWEAELPVAALPAFVARFVVGVPLPMVTSQGRVHVVSRDWTVWPGERTVRVRLALEDAEAV